MPTGFEKFSKKTLEEGGINLSQESQASKPFVETRAVSQKPVTRKAPEAPAKGKEKIQKEDAFQMTIWIRKELKRKLDELKYVHQKNYRELAEEAFEALYEKYR